MAALKTFSKDPDAVNDFTIRWGAPAWAPATQYHRGDHDPDVVVDTDGKFYRCVASHVSSAGARVDDAAKWKKLQTDLYLDHSATEILSTSVWVVPAGITEDSTFKTDHLASIWLSGGTAGETYELVNRITTSSGRTEDRSIKVKVKEA